MFSRIRHFQVHLYVGKTNRKQGEYAVQLRSVNQCESLVLRLRLPVV